MQCHAASAAELRPLPLSAASTTKSSGSGPTPRDPLATVRLTKVQDVVKELQETLAANQALENQLIASASEVQRNTSEIETWKRHNALLKRQIEETWQRQMPAGPARQGLADAAEVPKPESPRRSVSPSRKPMVPLLPIERVMAARRARGRSSNCSSDNHRSDSTRDTPGVTSEEENWGHHPSSTSSEINKRSGAKAFVSDEDALVTGSAAESD